MNRRISFVTLSSVVVAGLTMLACTDDSLMQPPAEIADVAEVAENPFSEALGSGQCMGDDAVNNPGIVSGFASDPNAFNCTANDVRIANARTLDGNPIQCVPNTQFQVSIVADVVETSTSTRHDIGIWIAEDGGNAETGECSFFYFDNDDINLPSEYPVDADGDACGDMTDAGTVTDFDLSNLTLTCPTDPVIIGEQTFIEVASCVSWTQPGGDRTCPIAGPAPNSFRAGTLPANKSKCNCEPFLVEVEILAQLTLLKTVINNDGGTAEDTAWTLTAASSDTTISGVEGDAEITSSAVPAGTFTLSESGGPADYSTTGVWACTGDGTFSSPNQIALGSGDIATCTITNTDDPLSLTLTKNVINDDGGTAADTAWTLAFSGPDSGSGVEGSSAVTNAAVDAGLYILSESGGPANYTSTGVWSCTGDGTFASPDSLTLGLGDTASCEITNDDIPAGLTLEKIVVNDDGGTAADTAWTLAYSGPSNGSGVEGDSAITAVGVNAGLYTLSESGGPSNYSTTGVWACTGDGTFTSPDKITLGLGDSATCRITNDDNEPHLTLEKTVINDDGGTAADTAWTLAYSGPSNGSGVEGDSAITNVPVDGGLYTLSESGGPANYSTTGVWVCTGDGTFTTPNTIDLDSGDSATCTITNTDDPLSLTLEKRVINLDGGTAVDTDWTLAFSGPDSGSGVEGSSAVTNVAVDAGTYVLSEFGGPANYSTTGVWSCTGDGTFASPDSITLALGDSAICEITNDDDKPRLTLEKRVILDDGGSASDTDWTLAYSGPSNGSGVEGEASITNVAVDGGTYTLSESGGPPLFTTDGVWACTGGGTFGSPNMITLASGDSATCEITNDDVATCGPGDRLTSVSLEVTALSSTPMDIGWTDDNGNLANALFTTIVGSVVGDTITIEPLAGEFFESQNLRFALNGEPSKNLKVHLSCSDDPAIGDIHFGDTDNFSATLEKTAFETDSP